MLIYRGEREGRCCPSGEEEGKRRSVSLIPKPDLFILVVTLLPKVLIMFFVTRLGNMILGCFGPANRLTENGSLCCSGKMSHVDCS